MMDSPDTGQMARTPRAIPAAGWKDILLRVWAEMGRDHIGLIGAGVAFYGLLALFPAITALMALAGLTFDASQVTAQIESISQFVPEAAADIIIDQAVAVTGSQDGGLGLAAILGFALAIWAASKGVGSLMEGINIAYDETETRGFVRLTLTRLGLTLFLVFGMVAGLGATIVLPSILSLINLGATTELLIGLARWIALLAMTVAGITVLYRVAPDRKDATWSWLVPGAVLATLLWIGASAAFAIYVQNFGSYQETFGTLAGVVILLMWLWISAYVILLGAELNAEAEAQTRVDSTVGASMPLGHRGAVKADTFEG
ncbi:Ribonuclease BN family protein [Pseudooceanicola batsensis HTCC2597]|uniref:Ribonuclease BN family protein n=1 Tax=Pseudooceanicola batsensis (strain ATCC BAA-863 / DSM 15984 / KCTC 12145 / HTCC2597) TaxID=252305 RepID=A3TYL4_PSEBH|nr:YihY/virulence factor BrkB family protein [Pseudooceanicola batsensis]EAQ03248.1 Ribonuclease BN family protein [Pseudooceanicola batsensis HTCC2597]